MAALHYLLTMTETATKKTTEALKTALRVEAQKVQATENLENFGGHRQWCALTMPTNCLIDPAEITANMGGRNCASYANVERHMIADLCNQATSRGWLLIDPTN